MSGGSLDYVYQRVENAADEIASRGTTAEHKAFAAHLRLVAKALHDLEWVWSSDYGRGDENAAIMALITPKNVLDYALAAAAESHRELERAIKLAGDMMGK